MPGPALPEPTLSGGSLPLRALALFLACFATDTVAAGDSISVLLTDGKHFQGRVVDLGGAVLEIGRRGGANQVPKSMVKSWTYMPKEDDAELQTVLVLRNRHEIAGTVELLEDTREWRVQLDVGVAKYPAAQVLRVIQPNGSCLDASGKQTVVGFTPRKGFVKRVERAIAQVRGSDTMRQKEGAAFLSKCGYFALRHLEEAMVDPKVSDTDPGDRLLDIAMRERIRVSLPPEIPGRFPKFVETMFTGEEEDRLAALKEAFFESGSEIFPLYIVLLLDTRQPANLRGYLIDLFQRTHRMGELFDVYKGSTGRAQLAAAIALGDAGAYIGIDTLIEALAVNDPAVRRMVVEKLTEYTGESYGFDPEKTSEAQPESMEKWAQWWDLNRKKAEDTLVNLLQPDRANPARLKAAQLWREGTRLWENRDVDRAEAFFKRAVETDPTCAPPFVCLGIIAYQNRSDYIAAEDYLKRAVRRVTTEGQDEILRLAFYHLGRIRESALRFREAQGYYEKAIEIDPNYAEAWRELGNVVYRHALTLDGAPEDRLERFRQAGRFYEKGLERLEQYREALVLLTLDSMPVSSDLPFSSRTHNRGLRDLRRRLRRTEAEFAYQVGVIHLAIGERGEAKLWAEKAVDSPDPLIDYHLFFAQVLSELGRDDEAKVQFEKAKALDPTDPRVKAKG